MLLYTTSNYSILSTVYRSTLVVMVPKMELCNLHGVGILI